MQHDPRGVAAIAAPNVSPNEPPDICNSITMRVRLVAPYTDANKKPLLAPPTDMGMDHANQVRPL